MADSNIARVVRRCFAATAEALAGRAEEINRLNVFPVPDGDTGTNMSLTMRTVVDEMESLPPDASMSDVSHAITHGSLMGARGNSGVITSQILRGVSECLAEVTSAHVTSADVAAALRNGVHVAFKAVRKPVEGTILTVLRDVSGCADRLEGLRVPVDEMLDGIVTEAYESVARTPDLLPVLKENGVVDSGGFGFAVMLDAFVDAFHGGHGEMAGISRMSARSDAKAHVSGVVAIELNDDWEGSAYRYCTEFLFQADEGFDEEANLRYLAGMGDCELLVGSHPDYKIHVHTNRPDRVLRHMLHRGQVFNVFVHNMDLEAHERTEGIRADMGLAGAGASGNAPRKKLGIVAVAAGTGQAEILESLGVDVVIPGGQTMNPSTADILRAIKEANADAVIVLPNNGNIRMAAEAAAEACDSCEVRVVPTKTVTQALSALIVVDRDSDVDGNAEDMAEAMSFVRYGEVTRAVRDSHAADGSPISSGDVMGIESDAIVVVGSDVEQVTVELVNRMQADEEGDVLTILAGEEMDDETFDHLVTRIGMEQPDIEIDAHRGEQPLYPVIFAME